MTDFKVGDYIYKIQNKKIDTSTKYMIKNIIKEDGNNSEYDIIFKAQLEGDNDLYIVHYINHIYQIDQKYAIKIPRIL
jgi:hypothetical protein